MFFLGIDLGTSAVKCILVNDRGEVKASASEEYPLLQPQPGWAEQHPEDWWKGTAGCIRKLLEKAGITGAEVAGVGLSGQMHGSVFLDKELNVVRPALLWCDQRTGAECEWIEETIGKEELGRLTGNKALTGFTAPKVIWLRSREPQNFERTAHLLLPKDYVRLQLTGEFGMDMADASGTLLLDVANRRWSEEVLGKLGIPASWLPPLFESSDIAGTVLPAAAELTGLAPGTPVVAGGGDQACGAVGVGVVRSGIASVALGTSGVVFVHDDTYQADEECRLHSFCHGVPGNWHRMGVMLAAGGSFQWWKNHFAYEELQRAEQEGRDVYEYLTELAASAPLGSEGLLFLPYLTGERTPHPDPKARGGFIGLNLRHGKAHLTRAVLEGITFGLRDSMELIKESGIAITELRVNGGGARSRFWRQMIADIFGYPVVTVNSTDGPAYGAAVMAASGVLKREIPDLCEEWIRVEDRVEPIAANQERYQAYYDIYRTLYGTLKTSFHQLSDLAAAEGRS
ncbi:xylulokinase [Paenibacillus mucilaginosus]|uniref:Xylulose kinase n=1 Tax=Paenibacillus mucilaginosus (strain KNP414) TaxID=1036673 RepID=F8FNR2_PAEMK|nr:xylulokinase [Paenibacillus mucilaginosus]AEI40174.1 xylulokinase [Paenibacillus mucilaginosus KNP414]MCG7215777.1 xylulokinase [Paenibacillus mucilaginosus]WDM29404.1 xylulokinase [Paenibacillus mucilaginosus]